MNEQNKKVPTIRFKGFTDDWEQRKLENIGKIVTGNTPSKKNKQYYLNGKLPFVSPIDINNNRYIEHTQSHVTELGFEHGRKLPKNTVLFVCIGSTIGKVAQLIQSAITNQQINSIVVSKKYKSDFIYSELYKLSDEIKLLASNQAVPIINKKTFGNIQINVTNIDEQEKVGKLFKYLDKAITLHQRKLVLLKQLKKGLLQKMFADKSKFPILRFEGFHDEWEQRKLGEVFLYKQGIQVPVEQQYSQKLPGLIRFIRISDIVSSNEPPRFINYHGTNLIKPDDLFMVRYGNPGMISMGYSGVIANNLFRLIPKKNIYTLFFYFLLIFENKRLNSLVSNTTMPALSFKALDTFYVNFPEKLSEQKVIGSLLKKLDSLITLQQRRLTKLNTIKKSLLQQMFI